MTDHIEDTRLRIIKAASDLFWAHGYERTTLSQIQQAAGVHGGSLYHFFRSKKEVARAVVRSYRDRLEPELIEPIFARFDDPIERIFGLLDGYRQLLLRTRYARGCPIGALALELADCDEEIREGLVENLEGWRQVVERCLREAAPVLVADADPEDLSRLVLTVMEGSVLQARAYRDLRSFDASVSQLRSLIERLRRSGTSPAAGGPIRWRMRIAAPPERVFTALDTDEGRAAFWAESAIETLGQIEFRFIDGSTYRSKVLERQAPRVLAIDYFGGSARFELSSDGVGGTDLLLTHEGVEVDEWIEVHAGWLNVLFPLKAHLAHGVDLRNHDPTRSWHDGYADQ